MNTFDGTVMSFPNVGIHFVMGETMKFRMQLTKRIHNEFHALSGWNDDLNTYMVNELNKIADSLESITYHPEDAPQEELEARAADTTRSLADDYDERALSVDNSLGPVGRPVSVVWMLNDTDPDIPQLTTVNCPNDLGRSFVTYLDGFFTEMSRLDSRHQHNMITKFESVNMRNLLSTLYAICQRKGGEVNRSDIPTGVLEKDEPNTFQG